MNTVRTVIIWATGVVAAGSIFGVIGNALVYDGGPWFGLGGICAFICARLWASERSFLT